MARIIFTSRFLKGASKRAISNLVKYIATRPGVVVDHKMLALRPATERQKDYVRQIVDLVPEIKESFEYEDFAANLTVGNASALIDKFVEDHISQSHGLKQYVDYIAKRPRAERSAGEHGLWSGTDEKIVLSKVAEEASNHKSPIWTHVISLRREDAARLGYDNAAAWRALVKKKIPTIAEAMNIPIVDLCWYGAFHDENHHPHVHLMVYSKHSHCTGRLYNPGIEKMRGAFATDIFKHDLLHIYEQQTGIRKELNLFADERIRQLTERINSKDYENSVVQEMLVQLSRELRKIKGRKVYGNLKGAEKQPAKNLVDAIVAELSKDKDISEIYGHWCDLQDEIRLSYMKTTPPPTALVNEKEFTTIKNMVLRHADGLDEKPELPQLLVAVDKMKQPQINIRERQYPSSAAFSVASLLKNMSNIITDDYFERLERRYDRIDKKILINILRKKQEHSMKVTLE